uniref:Uncharacterized protein n=1 Tax=Rhizophora mucronata TaxID=61149 RepID=A0A2P2Q6S4_RHIMU
MHTASINNNKYQLDYTMRTSNTVYELESVFPSLLSTIFDKSWISFRFIVAFRMST